uniref:Trans-sialidase n=1 Tax=Mesocestoides corti TaxID=53468 RepID=A0A5K3F0K3_MESCO
MLLSTPLQPPPYPCNRGSNGMSIMWRGLEGVSGGTEGEEGTMQRAHPASLPARGKYHHHQQQQLPHGGDGSVKLLGCEGSRATQRSGFASVHTRLPFWLLLCVCVCA